MRAATARAAMRRGCVWPMMPAMPRPASRQIFGSCVVLPEPVSPQTITTGCAAIARRISSRLAEIGNSSGYRERWHARRPCRARGGRRRDPPGERRFGGRDVAPRPPVGAQPIALAPQPLLVAVQAVLDRGHDRESRRDICAPRPARCVLT
jgi:hypothetical protein